MALRRVSQAQVFGVVAPQRIQPDVLDPWYVAGMLLAPRITLDFHCTRP